MYVYTAIKAIKAIKAQKADFQLHQHSRALMEEPLPNFMPEHSGDIKVASATSRLAPLC